MQDNSEHPVIIPHIEDNIELPKNAREALPDMSPEQELSMRSNTVKLISDLAGETIEPSQDNMEEAEEYNNRIQKKSWQSIGYIA